MQDKTFKFALEQEVAIEVSREEGIIVGRAQYATAENSYYLRYEAADGRATEAWWSESALMGEETEEWKAAQNKDDDEEHSASEGDPHRGEED